MKTEPTIDDILNAFDSAEDEDEKIRNGRTLTIWVSPETKKKYDAIQRRSGRRFSKILKQVIELSIDRKFDCDAG